MISIGLFWLVFALFLLRWISPPRSGRALPGASVHLEEEVARLRDEVDRMSGQVERLLDEQSFLLRLLEDPDRPAALRRGRDAGASREALPPAETPGQEPIH